MRPSDDAARGRHVEWLRIAWKGLQWRHLGLLVLALSIAALWTGWPLESLGYRFQLTRSGPRGIYQFVDAEIGVGDWVAVCLPRAVAMHGRERGYLANGPCAGNARPVLKRVVALGGDSVDVTDRVSIHGVAVSGSVRQSHDRHGRPIEAIPEGRYLVPPDHLWLATPAGDGWDSRYFGSVPRRLALAVAEPRLLID